MLRPRGQSMCDRSEIAEVASSKLVEIVEINPRRQPIKPDGNVITPDDQFSEPSRHGSKQYGINLSATGDGPSLIQPKKDKRDRRKRTKFNVAENHSHDQKISSVASSTAKNEEDACTRALNEAAIENYTRFYSLPSGCGVIEQVIDSAAGVLGWAAYSGPSLHGKFEESPIYPNSKSRQEILRLREQKKELKSKSIDHYMTEAGQEELKVIAKLREPSGCISELNYATGKISSASPPQKEVGGWVQIELTADSGACDSVMPKAGIWDGIKIWPSVQSERGFEYEVANGSTIPCLGERRLQLWTEGADKPRAMAIQVADVHKPLLSLSRCADVGYESRFGREWGCLYDVSTGDVIPLHRRGNLYFLRAWARAADISTPFGGQK